MILSGRKVLLVTSSLLTTFLIPHSVAAYTESNVKITTEGGDSHVSVTSDADSTTTTTTKSTGRTDIVIECNGVKKEYHSDKAENVTLNCDDSTSGTAKSEVRINSNSSSITPNPTIEEGKKKIKEEIDKKKEEIKKEVKSARDKAEKERDDLFKELTQKIRDFFKNFRF